jgi:hypothetical protein
MPDPPSPKIWHLYRLVELVGCCKEPIEVRKATLASILHKSRPDMGLNEHMEHSEGAVVFQHASRWSWRGLPRSGWDHPTESGRSLEWLKFKNPEAPAVKRGGRRGLAEIHFTGHSRSKEPSKYCDLIRRNGPCPFAFLARQYPRYAGVDPNATFARARGPLRKT